MPPAIDHDLPDAATAAAIEALAARVEAEDGAPPLNDQARAHLRSGDVTHVVARRQSAVVGYAQFDGESADVAAEPDVLAAVLDALPRPHTIWSHGARSRLVPVLENRGYDRVRELFQLRRPADLPLPADPALPDGVRVRAFVPGQDEDAWLALNAAAFVHHREQGRMTRADLDARMAEPWFDASAFLLADRDGELVGFHWTKTHDDGAGEVYVLGVSPDAQGLGLGGALLTRGLRLLVDRGCPYVLLYVDGDNPGAVHLYERDGFATHDVDRQWRTP